ncbi:glycosyltransferase family 4 protein [Synoicihabitans lomoniglobus]|uniref:Glycosyltransferase family 1 protein n=1 Tax=Synoicihabitans lomoniglobus TaxID=2909285 RepID=A0AAF0CSU3_9BACT|nr:glycosyltransferase family 4 protein [Opitutaceae bacterium LMO-M01]WED67398.1 glycosyltransferase family 1 protein [Opitutaceae bacterium LMO-M01]
MKIGLDVAQTSAERAGCAWYADALARAMVAQGRPRGHEFVLYHQFGDWINGEPGHGTSLTGTGIEMPMRTLLPVPARALWREIEAGNAPLPGAPDVVVASSFHAPNLPGAKLIYVVHDLVFWTHPQFATDATRLVCQRELGQAIGRAAAFLFVSESTRADFEALFPGWLDRSGIPHAIASGASRWPTVEAAATRAADAPWLMVGSVEPRKNHACVLDAYESYHASAESPRPLRIVGGRGWHSEKIHQRIAELAGRGLPIIYAGYVDDRALREAFRSSFALLQPSWHEGFGLPVLEAFSQGLPVIASDVASLPEVSAGAALHCPPDDPNAWTTAMLKLDGSSAEIDRLTQAGLKRASAYSWQKTAQTVLSLAESLTKSSPPVKR